jgi:hypothetical protein
MPQVWQANNMIMGWCLECHNAPEEFIRPVEARYTFGWEAPEGVDRSEYGRELLVEYNVGYDPDATINPLTNCSTCHR